MNSGNVLLSRESAPKYHRHRPALFDRRRGLSRRGRERRPFTVQVTNLTSHTWTNPGDALPLDPFSVTVTLSGTAPKQLELDFHFHRRHAAAPTATAEWLSANDAAVTVNTTLPCN